MWLWQINLEGKFFIAYSSHSLQSSVEEELRAQVEALKVQVNDRDNEIEELKAQLAKFEAADAGGDGDGEIV